MSCRSVAVLSVTALACSFTSWASTGGLQSDRSADSGRVGREVAISRHLEDDEEFRIPVEDLVAFGRKLFSATWTSEDGGGRPLTKGSGRGLSDPQAKLVGARAFNRISGPDANSCAGCHNQPHGIPGGGGDFVTNVFVLAQRFDFVSFDPSDAVSTKGAFDEGSAPVTLENVGNLRATTGLFGAAYLEMLAREITADLQRIRDSVRRGESRILESKGINFGRLARRADGTWDVREVVGLPRLSLLTATPLDPPSLVIRPWHQAANAVSLREFSNNALNHHHGIQTTERFGMDTDPDGDGVINEMTRADVTAISVYQAVLPVPGQVIPNDPEIEAAIMRGEMVFGRIGCASCHMPSLPLGRRSWIYSEPNPYNPPTNLRNGETQVLRVDLLSSSLPQPRLSPTSPDAASLTVHAYTDFKLHDITDPSDAPPEPLDMNHGPWSPEFATGNRRFLTKRLWGCANEPPYFHHGRFTTLRQSVLAHAGEARAARQGFTGLHVADQDALIEFLKSLQVLPAGTTALVVDERYQPKKWSLGVP